MPDLSHGDNAGDPDPLADIPGLRALLDAVMADRRAAAAAEAEAARRAQPGRRSK